MQLEIPTPEPVMVGRQEPLTIQLVNHLGSGSFRPITKSAHVNFGPCQFRPINFVNLDFCKRDDILLKIFKIDILLKIFKIDK